MAKKRVVKKNSIKTRVFVVSDYPIVRYGFSKLIHSTSDLIVAGESDFSTLSKGPISSKADLILIWIRKAEDTALIKVLKFQNPNAKILYFSRQREFTASELPTDANGYLTKHEDVESVLQAIRRIHKGEITVSEKTSSTVPRKPVLQSEETGIKVLTPRELEVFRLIGQGFHTTAIARELHLSVKTIYTYRERIKQKLGLENPIELVYNAVRWVQND